MSARMNPLRGLGWLPPLTTFWLFTTFVVSYAMGVAVGEVKPLFPYISDTGTRPPTSCVFGQFLNMAAALFGVNVFVRYRQVQFQLSHEEKIIRNLNTIGLIFGMMGALGMSIVANFQETAVLWMHLIGASFAFGLGWAYCVIQSWLSHFMYKGAFHSRALFLFRMFMTVLMFVLFIVTYVEGIEGEAMSDRSSTNPPPTIDFPFSFLFLNEVGGEKSPVNNQSSKHTDLSAIFEWLLGLSLGLFLVSFTSEFSNMRAETRVFVDSEDSSLPALDDNFSS